MSSQPRKRHEKQVGYIDFEQQAAHMAEQDASSDLVEERKAAS
jgi:hypothetical protein